MRDYLTQIQTTCDSLDSCGHAIEEMQQIPIILNGVNGQFYIVVAVIHSSQNAYTIASVSSALLDDEARQYDLLVDSNVSANVAVVSSSVSSNSVQLHAFTSFVAKDFSPAPFTYDGLLPTPQGHPGNQ